MTATQRHDAEIAQLLQRLRARFGAFDVEEEWDENVLVVGRRVPGEGERLLFACTGDCPPGRYGVAFDASALDDPPCGRGCENGLDFDALCAALAEHLRVSPLRT